MDGSVFKLNSLDLAGPKPRLPRAQTWGPSLAGFEKIWRHLSLTVHCAPVTANSPPNQNPIDRLNFDWCHTLLKSIRRSYGSAAIRIFDDGHLATDVAAQHGGQAPI